MREAPGSIPGFSIRFWKFYIYSVARDRRVIDLIIDRAARLFGRVFSLLSPACLQPRDTDHRRYLTLKFGTRACCTVHTPEVNLRAARDRRGPRNFVVGL